MKKQRTNRGRGRLIAVVTACLGVLLMIQPLRAAAGYSAGGGLLKLANAYYEIAFNQANGGIAYIVDQAAGARISEGNKDGILWWAASADGRWLGSINYGKDFGYRWDGKSLTLTYRASAVNPLEVTVTVTPSAAPALQMRAALKNNGAAAVRLFGFPSELAVIEDEIGDALLPMIPGAKLRAEFFTDHKSYDALYPGVMCADYLGLRSNRGKLAVYGLKGAVVQPVYLGFGHEDAAEDYTKIIHNYRTWVEPGRAWATPGVAIRVGEDYPATIAAYRGANGIDKFQPLAAKLGQKKQRFYESPMYKLDLEKLNQPFARLKAEVLDKLLVPGLLHPVAFQPIGFDHHYPDFLPPKAEWGDTASLADLIAYARQKGNLVMPYTNFSWWNPDAPTLQNLPAGVELRGITVSLQNGGSVSETYGQSDGYVMNLHQEFVRDRIAAEHAKLLQLGLDGIFEDQFGARSAPMDFNAAGLSAFDASTSYFEGVLAHARQLSGGKLMTECGIDMLARDEVGFMGTNYLWDLAGYRAVTAPYTDYYPLIGMLCRDKVLLYQHDLAGETWTDDKNLFRWNLAYGYHFSGSLAWAEHPWLPLIGVFQKYLLSRYADQLVTGFDELAGKATRTSFAAYKVYANWAEKASYACNGHVIAPGGAMAAANDGSATGGVFAAYNGGVLSDGDHYLIELRAKDGIRLFQPLGADTEICLNKFADWKGVNVTAYDYAEQRIGEVPATMLKDRVTFTYAGNLAGKKVCYYKLTPGARANPATPAVKKAPDLVVTELAWTPAKPRAGEKVTFAATIKNRGAGPAVGDKGFMVGFSLDGEPIRFWTEILKTPLAPGASITVEAAGGEEGRDWIAQPGEHIVQADIDFTNWVAESDEKNNQYSRALPAIAAPEGAAAAGPPRQGPQNLALGRPTAESSHTDIYVCANANDGFTSSYWESRNNVFPCSFTLDLGAVTSVAKIVLKLPPGWEPRTQTVAILGSEDGKSFAPILAAAKYLFDPGNDNIVTVVFTAARLRYLRLEFTENTGWPAGQIAEIEVYGG